ncbi:MAG: 2-amino-5-formylamino-6-ribosylaminopyrimidin-4(3H)-one 5'-monophosphate deformylase [Candidatus Hadarchaeota archaeon]|nr:2-amino-5-formylamino-6-ribosylaminopyrimidin-4(3H)-one 5'-monophosphate deformylase [Candidatus Hadarchaeota archaeon]
MRVGVLALGSHDERHGAALPPDTDARIAERIAREAARRTGASFLGVLCSSYELPGIDTGEHQSLGELVGELRGVLRESKEDGVQAVVLVNAHGGNQKLREKLDELEQELSMKVRFNTTVTEIEGPHAGTGELSIGAVIEITDESRLGEHSNFERYPEVGFVGLKEARRRYSWAEEHAHEVLERGVRVDKSLGDKLLERAIADAVKDVEELGRS